MLVICNIRCGLRSYVMYKIWQSPTCSKTTQCDANILEYLSIAAHFRTAGNFSESRSCQPYREPVPAKPHLQHLQLIFEHSVNPMYSMLAILRLVPLHPTSPGTTAPHPALVMPHLQRPAHELHLPPGCGCPGLLTGLEACAPGSQAAGEQV